VRRQAYTEIHHISQLVASASEKRAIRPQRKKPVINFGAQAADYARFRQGPDKAFFERLATYGVGLPGQAVLDLGTGTGLFARALAQRGCAVTAIDPSEPLLAEARKADRQIAHVDYRLGVAENTGLPSSAFDCVTASTCWHWFDRAQAAREAYRLLRSGGKLAIVALDWLQLPGNVIETTLEVIQRHRGSAYRRAYTFIYPEWTSDLVAAGFRTWQAFAYTTALAYTHEAWCGRVRASTDLAALSRQKLLEFSADLTNVLRRKFPADPFEVEHKVFCLTASKNLP
jgi:ubiquinone/menaquinone biosynthesis C-methylase UbiE